MLRSSLTTMGVVLLGATALAQSDLSSKLRPITSPVKNAGVLHLGTGTWTRHATGQANLAGPEVVYANTCNSGYFGAQVQNEVWTDEGAIPDAGEPSTPSVNIPGGFDTNPGCASSYNINGFQIAYCTDSLAYTATVNFYNNYEAPGTNCAVPGAAAAGFNITGLPASSTAGVQACWLVSLDLQAASASFSLNGTGTNNFLFGWSYSTTSVPFANNTDGPIIAGGPLSGGTPTVCTGTDATKWDTGTASIAYPANRTQVGNFPVTNEQGTGMLTQDAFRIDNGTVAAGCYFFLGNPLGSFHLELYSDTSCTTSTGVSYCFPGVNGVIACPCGNNPSAQGRGCNNSVNTGGAILTATGNPSVGTDTLVLTATNERPNVTSLFLQGNANLAAGAVFGDGVRCAGGQLLRLNSPGGTPADGAGTVVYPNAGFPQSVSARSNALGQPILPGNHRFYQTYYRDPDLNFCPNPPGNTWNVTQALDITWTN